MNKIIKLPRRLNESNVVPVLTQMWETGSEEELCFDISETIFTLPFASLILASEISYYYSFSNRSINIVGYNPNSQAHSYLSHIGFFKLASFNIGKEPGEALGSSQYIPFKVIEKCKLDKIQRDQFAERLIEEPISKIIAEEARGLAEIILDKSNQETCSIIAYCFREIMRNVFEHSNTNKCLLCAQKYSNGIIEVAIADNGCGVLSSMKQTFEVDTHEKALKEALRPGITSKNVTGETGFYNNSGYGLYILSELGKYCGKFSICSGDRALSCSKNFVNIQPFVFDGTAVQLRLSTNNDILNSDLLDYIINDGEKIAAKYGGIKKAGNSRYSKT